MITVSTSVLLSNFDASQHVYSHWLPIKLKCSYYLQCLDLVNYFTEIIYSCTFILPIVINFNCKYIISVYKIIL